MITVVPANQASWDDIRAVLGMRGDPASCYCQSYKIRDRDWASVPREERAARMHEQTACGIPHSPTTSGLVAYLDGEPVGWCAVEPRTAYLRLLYRRVPGSVATRTRPTTESGRSRASSRAPDSAIKESAARSPRPPSTSRDQEELAPSRDTR